MNIPPVFQGMIDASPHDFSLAVDRMILRERSVVMEAAAAESDSGSWSIHAVAEFQPDGTFRTGPLDVLHDRGRGVARGVARLVLQSLEYDGTVCYVTGHMTIYGDDYALYGELTRFVLGR